MEGSSGRTTVDAGSGCGVVGSRGVVCVGLIDDVVWVGRSGGTGGLVVWVGALEPGIDRDETTEVVLDAVGEGWSSV